MSNDEINEHARLLAAYSVASERLLRVRMAVTDAAAIAAAEALVKEAAAALDAHREKGRK